MPREFSEDTERYRPPEIDETCEQQEVDEVSKTAEEIASEASEELERREKIEHLAEEAIKELEELDSKAERVEKIARESVKELEGMEEDLGHDLEKVREELHEEFVNDMESKLEESSLKDTSSESKETTESGEAEETSVSSESHIDSSDGMVYVTETGEVSESKAELEIEESVDSGKEEAPEVQQTSEENSEIEVQEQSTKIRNSIVRPENSESEEAEPEQVETPERKKERITIEEQSIEETSVDEPKRDHKEKGVVKDSQEIEEISSTEGQEEISEVAEEKKDTEKEHLDTSNESRETSSETEREEITTESDEIIKDELTESLEVEDDLELPVELPEEIEQDIEELAEELVEDLETQEEEEQVDESRIIVDAMTGKEHIDRSLEYRPYYQETEEGSEQNEQEKVKEKIDEMFAKLSEEEREKFKESVRSKLKTENLDEWVKRNSSVKASPDYKEKYKDAKKYLRGKQKGKVPRLIKELWKDEVERAWTSAVGSVILRTMDRILSKAMKPKGRVVSFDIQQHLNLNKNKAHTINKEFQQSHNLTGKNKNTRYGVINGKLLIWKPNVTPIQLETAYSELYYYFRDKESFEQYIRDVGDSLGIPQENRNEIEKTLHELASQMFTEQIDDNCINTEIRRVCGDYIHLINDISGKTLSELGDNITKLTKASGKGGIVNPKFPEGRRLEEALARLTAIAVSDCHLKPNGTLEYAESEMSRIKIVERDLQVFGDIMLNPKKRENENLYLSYLPTPLGVMLMYFGIPSGDRSVQNPGLYCEIMEFSPRAKCALIEDLVPQDGTISGKKVQWTHTNVLDAANKAEIYGVKPKIGKREIDFIKSHGKKEKHSWVLNYGTLKELRYSKSDRIRNIARFLWKCVHDNPNRLILDQIEVVSSLGINYRPKPYTIRYHKRTGRVSVAWTAVPDELLESIKIMIIAPPNDIIKRAKVKDIIKSHSEYVVKALKQFKNQGLDVDRWWNVE